MKNTFFSPACQRLLASKPNRLIQLSLGGHLGSPDETALDTAHQTELTAVRKPLPATQLNIAEFFSRRTERTRPAYPQVAEWILFLGELDVPLR